MRITLTKPQLLNILANHFNTPVEDVVIADPQSDLADKIEWEMRRYNLVTEKIAAIKHLRQVSVDHNWDNGRIMYLADAKWAIENFDRYVAFVRNNNRLPIIDNGELK